MCIDCTKWEAFTALPYIYDTEIGFLTCMRHAFLTAKYDRHQRGTRSSLPLCKGYIDCPQLLRHLTLPYLDHHALI